MARSSPSAETIDPPIRDFDPEAVGRLLRGLSVRGITGIGPRMGEISRRLLGRPYRIEPLGGSPGTLEALSLSVSFFDCVTFIEHVMALARCGSADEFPENVLRLRYRQGRVTWSDRNHYMTGWIRNNTRTGLVRPLLDRRPFSARTVVRSRRLDVVPGLASRDVGVRGLPKRDFLERGPELETGDMVFFMSTRRHLDMFHCGLVVASAAGPCLLRHASRSRGAVVEQTLASFASANRMSGIIAVRPVAA
jgi:D-alanyl-D-alanine carboxypeptidase/D-alanyl-D-alanine-endopeptidase (penicillin-binding protein 4)